MDGIWIGLTAISEAFYALQSSDFVRVKVLEYQSCRNDSSINNKSHPRLVDYAFNEELHFAIICISVYQYLIGFGLAMRKI